MVRNIFLIGFLIFCLAIKAQNASKETISALNFIYSGYTEYGVQELMKSSRLNDVPAQYYLAVCYEYGIVVEKDSSEAFNLYRRAAERGLLDAMYRVAMYYKNGEIVSQSNAKYSEWIKRYERRGGKNVLPDLLQIYNEGLKYPANYSLNPTEGNNSNYIANNNINVGNNVNTNNTTINITYATPQPIQRPKAEPSTAPVVTKPQSDVDVSIPQGLCKNEQTFAVIVANENYRREAKVPYANNDGEIFKEYCIKVLGVPEKNIKYIADASLNDLKYNLNWLKQVMDVYQGEAKVVFYYAGHGIPDEANKTAYLLPVDGYASDIATGYSLKMLYGELGQMPAKSVLVLLDACFSGSKREGDMLASARGVAIKVKPNEPKGKLVVFSAAQGDETAYPYKEQGHGMFTYFLLKKLQEKWRIAIDRPGSGNTKNIGSVSRIDDLINGNGTFSVLGEEVFNDYWMYYLTSDMAKKAELPKPYYSNLSEYKHFKHIN